MDSGNPLLFKAHSLLQLTVAVVLDPGAHGFGTLLQLFGLNALTNAVLAGALARFIKVAVEIRLGWWRSYWLVTPALAYVPTMITILSDVLNHRFRLADRMILMVVVLVLAQGLAGWFGILIRYRNGTPIGLFQGLATSSLLLLVATAICLLLLCAEGSGIGIPGIPAVPMSDSNTVPD